MKIWNERIEKEEIKNKHDFLNKQLAKDKRKLEDSGKLIENLLKQKEKLLSNLENSN